MRVSLRKVGKGRHEEKRFPVERQDGASRKVTIQQKGLGLRSKVKIDDKPISSGFTT